MRSEIVTSLISAFSIITGSLLGALFSYIISDKMYKKQLLNDKQKDQLNKEYEAKIRNKVICDNVNQIRLDMANAIFQSIRTIKSSKTDNFSIHLLPFSSDYSTIISSLNHLFTLQELSDIYQFYAIVDKVSNDIKELKNDKSFDKNKILDGFISILRKIYGENYDKILLVDSDTISYIELFKNDYTIHSFKKVLFKLEKYSVIKNLLT